MCWKNLSLTPYYVIIMFSCPSHFIFFIFFKHTKHIVKFTDSGNMSILNQVLYYLPCIYYLTLETYVFKLDSLYLIVTICNGLLQLCCLLVMLSLYPNDGLSMIFFHLFGQLLTNMWEHQVTTMLLKCLCLRLLASKN